MFETFDLQMCFAPQRRALFRHLKYQKLSEPDSFYHCLLRSVLRATAPYTFLTSQLSKLLRDRPCLTLVTSTCGLTSQLPKLLRDRQCSILETSKCASRHNGVQFVISHLPRCLRTRRFIEPPFRPSGATKHWKNTWFLATLLPFRAPASLLF